MRKIASAVLFVGLLFLAVCLAGCLGLVLLGRNSSEPSLRAGRIVAIRSGDETIVASTSAALDRVIELSVARDADGLSQMESAGRIFLVSDGTKARVINGGFLSSEVRIIEGIHSGRSGWVQNEFLAKR